MLEMNILCYSAIKGKEWNNYLSILNINAKSGNLKNEVKKKKLDG